MLVLREFIRVVQAPQRFQRALKVFCIDHLLRFLDTLVNLFTDCLRLLGFCRIVFLARLTTTLSGRVPTRQQSR